MMYIHSIRVFEECEECLRKNLQTDKAFVFEKMAYEDFYPKNISVFAIVGKNGSGKSTLLEMMFRMVNNLSYVLLHDIRRAGAYPLRYVYGIWANMDYELDGKFYRLCCQDKNVMLMELDRDHDYIDGTIIIDAKVEVPHVKFYRMEYPEDNKCEIDIEQYRELAEKLFYTVVVNYSMQAYVEQDFQDEKTEWQDGKAYSPHWAEKAWINSLFHKNDGYTTPLVLNPYRDKGIINMVTEHRLTLYRLSSCFIHARNNDRQFIRDYYLHRLYYEYNPSFVKDKLVKNWDASANFNYVLDGKIYNANAMMNLSGGEYNDLIKVISVYSDFMNMSVVGDYKLTQLPASLAKASSDILPTIGKMVADNIGAQGYLHSTNSFFCANR